MIWEKNSRQNSDDNFLWNGFFYYYANVTPYTNMLKFISWQRNLYLNRTKIHRFDFWPSYKFFLIFRSANLIKKIIHQMIVAFLVILKGVGTGRNTYKYEFNSV